MKLSNKELEKYYFGALEFEETPDGYLEGFHFSKPQIEYFKKTSDFWYERCLSSTCKTIEFASDATTISFDYKVKWIGTRDTIELVVDGVICEIVYLKNIYDEGKIELNLPNDDYDTSNGENTDGLHNIIIYLPSDSTVVIKNFELNASKIVRPTKKEKVLWLGDSITQGFGTFRSAETYVSIANRLLGYDIINQGIGGYVYDKNSLMKMNDYMPDKIIVALGTNQYGTETMTDIEEYYERLFEVYGTDIPVLVITPLWRGDNVEGIPTLISFCNKLKKIIKKYPNIKMVDGFNMVPHLPEYFIDNLHPNELGAEIYGRNLVNEINRLNF